MELISKIENWNKKEKAYDWLVFAGCALSVIMMYARVFFGTEITDEAYYIADALGMLNGNVPFVFNNASKITGSFFLLIPQLFIYRLFVPDCEGVFLFTRLSFVTFRLIILFVIYLIIRKSAKRSHALLLIGLMIPCYGGGIQNYSYNTVPFWLCLLTAFILYDAIEQNAKHAQLEIIISGFLSAVTCIANPGYGMAVIVFLAIIFLRIKEKKVRCRYLLEYLAGALLGGFIVFLPIIFLTSIQELWYGLYRLYIEPFPVKPLVYKDWHGIILELKEYTKVIGIVFVATWILVYMFSKRYICENEKRLSDRECALLAVTSGILADILCIFLKFGTDLLVCILGFLALLSLIPFCILKLYKGNSLFYYIGVYPILYSIAEIILVASGAGIGRFYYSFPVLIIIFMVLLDSKSELIRVVTTISIVVCILQIGFADFKHIYRDDGITALDYKVENGVYKGVYTSASRLNDLPELEAYLNSVIEEDEIYAFRDNVPGAYLMMHHGIECEISTWDIMQYSYGRNTPAIVFDYYKRRNMIPDKIVYIDYGRDANLSIEDANFRYNDFVNEYYDLVEDIRLNDTFYHVMVFKNNGSFDGNYDYWINTYYEILD